MTTRTSLLALAFILGLPAMAQPCCSKPITLGGKLGGYTQMAADIADLQTYLAEIKAQGLDFSNIYFVAKQAGLAPNYINLLIIADTDDKGKLALHYWKCSKTANPPSSASTIAAPAGGPWTLISSLTF